MVALAGPRVATGNTAVPAAVGLKQVPGPATWPVVHAGLAVTNLWAIIRITALAYLSVAGPVAAGAPVPAAWARAPAA
eukprot:8839942-Alexandrium_andersonii.AAC.1